MTTHRDVDAWISAWLTAEAPERAPDDLIEASRAQLRTTRQRRAWVPAWRSTDMRAFRIALTATAVVAVAILGYRLVAAPTEPGTSPGATLQPTAQSQSPLPTATGLIARPMPAQTSLPAGRYVVEVPGSEIRAEFTVGAGWSSGGGGMNTPDWYISSANGSISFWTVANVVRDACAWDVPRRPTGPGVQDFVAALAEQRNSRTTAPVDVTVGGYPAKQLDIAPAPSVPCEELLWWFQGDGETGRGAQAGQATPDTVYAIDVGGERTIIVAYQIGPATAFAGILGSLTFVQD